MIKNLLIVESPAKAKTIEKILGKDFKVESCYGHIRDLPKENKAIDVENNFKPLYIIPEDKEQTVEKLGKLIEQSEQVWLATDEDREGEAISWHLCEVFNLNVDDTKRIVFHEITKPALLKAIQIPRKINLDLVDAQQARRLLDRLVGFEISPILWRKISNNKALSAGRVQSVAVRLVVEREREIQSFQQDSFYKINAYFNIADKEGKNTVLKAELPKRFDTEAEGVAFLQLCSKAIFKVNDLQVKPVKRKPAAPFTTSTLQQEAGRKLGYSVSKTMLLAQRLYEAGFITYMRTDSVVLSDTAREAAAAEIEKSYGKQYVEMRQYNTQAKDAQEAHEAIRPTYFEEHKAGATAEERALYELIWKRTLASQMRDADLERTIAKIGISTSSEELTAQGEMLKFDGFLRLYRESFDDEDDSNEDAQTILPPLSIGQHLELKEMRCAQRQYRAPYRYSEASLVKKMEELGIGRPSTYAPTINTILKREYVKKDSRDGTKQHFSLHTLANGNIAQSHTEEIIGAEKHKLFPTDMGKLVNDFLVEHFEDVVNYDFTAKIEAQFDHIANGDMNWVNMLSDFYKPFKQEVLQTSQEAKKITGERVLGIDPKSGKEVSAKLGRYGKMIQIGKAEDEEKPLFAKMLPHQEISDIRLEDALALFALPRTVGVFEGKEIQASDGKFGPYVVHNKVFASIPKNSQLNPLTITLEEAVAILEAKREQVANKIIQEFNEDPDIKILNGLYGPYIKAGKNNIKLPKGKDPKALTFDEVVEIIQTAPPPSEKKKARSKK